MIVVIWPTPVWMQLAKKSHSCAISFVLFDKYTAKSSITDDTRQQRTGGKSLYKPAYKVEDSTQIRDCLAGKKTTELLTLYLAEKEVEKSKSAVTTVTHKDVLSNQPAENVVDLNSNLRVPHRKKIIWLFSQKY